MNYVRTPCTCTDPFVVCVVTSRNCRQGKNRTAKLQPRIFNTYMEAGEAVARGHSSSQDENNCRYLVVNGAMASRTVNTFHCKRLVITGRSFFINQVSFVFPLNSPHVEKFSAATLYLSEEGTLPSIEEYFNKQSSASCGASTQPSLSFRRLRLFFIMAFAAVFFIFVEMIVDPQKPVSHDGDDGDGQVAHNGDGDSGGGGGGGGDGAARVECDEVRVVGVARDGKESKSGSDNSEGASSQSGSYRAGRGVT